MNTEMEKLIEHLAQKLGTTTEYLWGVLINQAKISAITDLFYLFFTVIGGILLYRLHKYFSKEREPYGHSYYYTKEELVTIPMGILTVFWFFIAIFSFMSIGNIINGFFNPEYWALDQILNLVK